mmetsp:Transcript_12477/g.23765  ORF Transcript_12477/g.23765 Transcript_12477/m.23765 type:complete len:145 (+) Transcript_12477:173-607(+)|eukprot:CAMPEP_0201628156 /NCGR_PEP_ID=MMETSP0493-20130528/3197_1 /ASSEMBLY_ACC=CAM_ASM_000838 /TAXON_ID=420259 /ORGANISM="Thalassiosira gravida, Strain GMp14c1" /LENGTH=144 /DNA_ID=CAMNT_0048098861 /DNA_START=90 /DNA_END=524 /DNA_ORIENTATION=+
MGLLKHAILPFYALLNLTLTFKCLVFEDMMEDSLKVWPRDTKDYDVPITDLEKHCQHCLGGIFACLLLNNIAAIFVENSHYRGMAVLIQVLFFVVDGYSYVRLGKDVPAALFVVVGVGIFGLGVNSKEPGVFTKDKGANKAKNR